MRSITVRLNYSELEAIHACIKQPDIRRSPVLSKVDMKLRRARFTLDYKRKSITGQPA